MINDVEVRFDFFPEDLLAELVADIDVSTTRKREFSLGDPAAMPGCLERAAAFASQELGLEFNLAILKWYRLTDPDESAAYEAHRDPERLASIPLVLCTLKGEADLIVWSDTDDESEISCVDNMLVLLNPHLTHRITPPSGPGGERYLLFLGFDTSVRTVAP